MTERIENVGPGLSEWVGQWAKRRVGWFVFFGCLDTRLDAYRVEESSWVWRVTLSS